MRRRQNRLELSLRQSGQIRQVLENGKLSRGRHLLVRIFPSTQIVPAPSGSGPFFAAVITRKKEKRATARNRMKRRLREIFRHALPALAQATAYVVIARKVDPKIPYAELEQDFLETVKNA